ncbi:MAG: holo-ACP synthase [Actinomycetota bacterium]|nr:holo-ACP synthase [Actinomycetota bacterium]
MTVVGVGVDLVHIPSFEEQMDQPGTGFDTVFTPGERSDVRSKGSTPARHFAVRWAAKEAVIKAWSASIYGEPPVMDEQIHHLIEVVTDAWGRPRIKLHGEVAKRLPDVEFQLSLSHDGDYATAYVVMTRP